MKLPFMNSRASSATSEDVIIAALLGAPLSQNGITIDRAGAIGACAGWWARAMTSAELEGLALSAFELSAMGRNLALHGEAVYILRLGEFLPATVTEVQGGPRQAEWLYRLDVSSPSGAKEAVRVPAARVAHVRYGASRSMPWKGVAPHENSPSAGLLAAGSERRVAEEASAKVGGLLTLEGVQSRGGDKPADTITKLLAGLKGQTGVVPAQMQAAKRTRIGGEPPSGMLNALDAGTKAVAALFGVPVALLLGGSGVAGREAFRSFISTTIEPIARLAADEFSRVLGTQVSFRFPTLTAADVGARARAAHQLTQADASLDEALQIVGLK